MKYNIKVNVKGIGNMDFTRNSNLSASKLRSLTKKMFKDGKIKSLSIKKIKN